MLIHGARSVYSSAERDLDRMDPCTEGEADNRTQRSQQGGSGGSQPDGPHQLGDIGQGGRIRSAANLADRVDRMNCMANAYPGGWRSGLWNSYRSVEMALVRL